MYNLIEYSDSNLKTSGSLWQYCRDKPAVNNNGIIVDFNEANVISLFNFKEKLTSQTGNNGTNNNTCWNNNSTKISKQFLDNSRNAIN